MSSHHETFAALLTPPGRGAVAVVHVAGPAAVAAVDRCFRAANGPPLAQQPFGAIRFGRWSSETGEEVVVCRTADDRVEVHCHGGDAAPRAVLDDLAAAGCTVREWSGHSNDADSLIEVEARRALADCVTDRAAAVLLDQLGGALAEAVADARRTLAAGKTDDAADQVAALLALGPLGRRLTSGWRVVIAGRPNVGKSSLMNAIVGYRRAIVFDEPGVTRDVVSEVAAIEGWPVELSDTAGLRDTDDPLEAASAQRARAAIESADLVLLVEAFGEPITPGTSSAEDLCERLGLPTPSKPIRVANKADLAMAGCEPGGEAMAVSATTGAGLAELVAAIGRRLVPDPPPPGRAVPFTARQQERLTRAAAAIDLGDLEQADGHLQAVLAPAD
ncbi:MAG: GTPase [Planctomycetota bacterium]